MSAADYAVMVPLSEAPNGQLRTKDLGIALGWDRSRTSHQVTRMVKRGLGRSRVLRRRRSRFDRWPHAPRAERPSTRLHPTTWRWFAQLFFDPLSDDELDALGVVLDRMLAAIRRYTTEHTADEVDGGRRRPGRGRAKRRIGIERHA